MNTQTNYSITINEYNPEKGYISVDLSNDNKSFSKTIFKSNPKYGEILDALVDCEKINNPKGFTIPKDILSYEGQIITEKFSKTFVYQEPIQNKYSITIKRFTTSFVEVTLVNHNDDSDRVTTKFKKDSEQTKELYWKIFKALQSGDLELTNEGILLPNTPLTGQIIIAVV